MELFPNFLEQIQGRCDIYRYTLADEQSNHQTIDTADGIRQTSGGFFSSIASLRISDGVVLFLFRSLDPGKLFSRWLGSPLIQGLHHGPSTSSPAKHPPIENIGSFTPCLWFGWCGLFLRLLVVVVC